MAGKKRTGRPYNSGAGGKRAADLLDLIARVAAQKPKGSLAPTESTPVELTSSEHKSELELEQPLPLKGQQLSFVRRLGALGADLAVRYQALYDIFPAILPAGSRILTPDEVNFSLLPAGVAAGIATGNAVTLGAVESLYLRKMPSTAFQPLQAVVRGAVRCLVIRGQGKNVIGSRGLGFSVQCEGAEPERWAHDALAKEYCKGGYSPQRGELSVFDLHVAFAPQGEVFPASVVHTARKVMEEAIPVGSEFTLLPLEPAWEGLQPQP